MSENVRASAAGTAVTARHYVLVCSVCGHRQDDDGTVLECQGDHAPALLRTEYRDRRFTPRAGAEGIFRYRDWLPVVATGRSAGRSAVFRSRGLARALYVDELWIAFNGYWPERGAALDTCTFKEFEAHTVLGRLPDDPWILTVASSGNTGAAFAWAASQGRIPCLLVVPEKGLSRLRFRTELDPCVTLVVIEDGDYPDAIDLAARVGRLPSFRLEGGVKNVGRRDGLATVMISAVEAMGRLPSHYFQAVGSGTGAIAALEAARRFMDAGVDGPLPRLMLCQNLPFTPVLDAWQAEPEPLDRTPGHYREVLRQACADELANLTPPYAIGGGVRDSLVESAGDVLAADNAAVQEAMKLFLDTEGIDIEPAAGVAVACLADAAARGRLDDDSVVLLNITGGGRSRLGTDHALIPATPRLRIPVGAARHAETVEGIAALCGR
ncbi:cysteate synthase [Streptomyces sp. NPDC001714]|uniref:cysteate synthase n=1 Tax=Streptomyces sp. NPDC001714 TaxID=3364603 RepID=UPI0036AB3960